MELITLREMCELLHVSRRSIQRYEKFGLIQPKDRNKYGHLLYDEGTLHRAEKIRFLQQLGFKLSEIKQIIDAPNNVMKEALIKQLDELEYEKKELEMLIKKTNEYINKL